MTKKANGQRRSGKTKNKSEKKEDKLCLRERMKDKTKNENEKKEKSPFKKKIERKMDIIDIFFDFFKHTLGLLSVSLRYLKTCLSLSSTD